MTDTEMVDGVPTKIVMVGTSSMSLHQRVKLCIHIFRFSRMQKPKTSSSRQVADRPPVRGAVRGKLRGLNVSSRRAAVMRSEQVYEILEPLSTGFVDEYVPVTPSQVRRLRAPVLYKRPIEERVTLPPAPEVVYVPVPIPRNQKKGRGSRGRGLHQNQGQRNNVRGVINRGYFKGRPNTGRGGHVGNGRRGGKTVPTGHYPPLAKKSVSQLDRELEEYMKKSKHPKIII